MRLNTFYQITWSLPTNTLYSQCSIFCVAFVEVATMAVSVRFEFETLEQCGRGQPGQQSLNYFDSMLRSGFIVVCIYVYPRTSVSCCASLLMHVFETKFLNSGAQHFVDQGFESVIENWTIIFRNSADNCVNPLHFVLNVI